MKNINLRNAIWRSRAVAILGFIIIILAIFKSLPSPLKTTLFIVLGLLILAFGFAGSRHKSYSEPEEVLTTEVEDTMTNEQIFPMVETDVQMPMSTEKTEVEIPETADVEKT